MQNLQLDAILTVVDAKHILLHLDEEKPDGVVNESVQQVGAQGTAGQGRAGQGRAGGAGGGRAGPFLLSSFGLCVFGLWGGALGRGCACMRGC